MRVVFQMQGGRFDATSQEASDEDGEDDDEEEDLETMTVTESGDVGEGALEQVAPAPFDSLSWPSLVLQTQLTYLDAMNFYL